MLYNYFKLALRQLLRSPGFSLLNLTGFALGIACAFTGIKYAQQEFGYDTDFVHAERIYRVGVDFMGMGGFANSPEILAEHVRANASMVEAIAQVRGLSGAKLFAGERSISVQAFQTDSFFFKIFDFEFISGNVAQALASPDEAIITDELAERWFGSSNVLGEIIYLGEEKVPYRVGGVVKKANRKSHIEAELWVPIYAELTGEGNWMSARYYTYFLLEKGISKKQFQAYLDRVVEKNVFPEFASAGQSIEDWLASEKAFRLIVSPLPDIHLKSKLRFEMGDGGDESKVWGFLVIGLFVLVVAIVNFVNLSTARSSQRAKEIGVKKTIGAQKSNLLTQFGVEALTFGAIAGLAALGLTEFLQVVLERITGEALLQDSLLQPGVILSFFAFCLLVSLLAGVYPALFLTSFRPVKVLKGNLSRSGGKTMRSSLVVLQFTISGFLMIGSLVVWKQLDFMQNKDLGFDREGVFVIENARELGEHNKAFQAELEKLPLVKTSSFSQSLPAGGSIIQKTFKTPEMEQSIPLRTYPADADFLETLGIELVSGQYFKHNLSQDTNQVLLTQSAAAALGLSDPLGADVGGNLRVGGVVSDFHIESLRHGIQPVVFTHALNGSYLSVRLSTNTKKESVTAFVQAVENLWDKFSPEASMEYDFLDDSFARLAHQEEVQGKGILALTLLSIFIACLGLFGLTAFTAEQRTKEIGIRKVLGASVLGIVALLSKDFLKLVVISLLVASPLAFYFAQKYLADFAYRVELNEGVFIVAALVSVMIAFVTIGFQSVKAAMVNPVESLKNE